MHGAQSLGVPCLEDAVPVPQIALGPGLHGSFLHHGVIIAVNFVPSCNGLAPAQSQFVRSNVQQAADILLTALAQSQQLEVGVCLFTGLHALGAPHLQLMHHSGYGTPAGAGNVSGAQHHGLGRKALLHIKVDQLFHFLVGQRAGKPGLRAVDEAGDHGVGAACGSNFGPCHRRRGAGLLARCSVFFIALQQARTCPKGQRTFGADAAAQFEVGADLVRVGDAGSQHIQRHAYVVFLCDAEL